jgi:penicillin-binding protein 2
MGFRQDHLDFIHSAMSEVVNGRGTAGRAKLPIDDVLMAGKTGTAQVVGLNVANGKSGAWKYRDHGHFIAFAPFDKPKYACAVIIEHGGGSGAAYPIARDVMTYLFAPDKAMAVLDEFEKQWGGNVQQRMSARYDSFAAQYGGSAPKPVPDDEELTEQAEQARKRDTAPAIVQTDAASPRPEPVATAPQGTAPATNPSGSPAAATPQVQP